VTIGKNALWIKACTVSKMLNAMRSISASDNSRIRAMKIRNRREIRTVAGVPRSAIYAGAGVAENSLPFSVLQASTFIFLFFGEVSPFVFRGNLPRPGRLN